MSRPLSPPVAATAGGLIPVVGRVIDAVRTEEARLARRLPTDWVASNGPRYLMFRDGMVNVHEKWETLRPHWAQLLVAVRNNRGDLPELERALIEMAAACVKAANDMRAIVEAQALDPDPDW